MEAYLAPKLYNFIFDCKGGEIELLDLIRYQSPLQGFTEARAIEILSSSEQEDSETKQKKKTFAMEVNSEGRKTVRVSCKARICFSYESNGRCSQGGTCRNLHICKGFLEENCHDPNICSRSHNLLDNENKNILQKLDCRIVRRPNSNIRKMISKNLPCVCKNYLNNQCRNELCQNLHLCSRFVRDACCSEENNCPSQLSHDLTSSHNKKIFKKYQVPKNYLKCDTLLPKGTKIEKISERGQRSKTTSMNNLDVDDDSEQHSVKSIEFTQNISLGKEAIGCHCLATSWDEKRHNGSLQHRYTEETDWGDWGLDEVQTNPILASPSQHPQNSNLQKWVSVGCFKMAPSSSPTCGSDGQNILRPCRSVGGKQAPEKVGMACGMSNGAKAKPVNWAGRGRGRPQQSCLPTQELPGQVVQQTSSEQLKTIESFKLEIMKAVRDSLLDQFEIARGIFNCILTKFNGTARFSDISFSTDPVFLFTSVEEKEKWFRAHKSSFLIIENNQGSIEEVKTISSKAKMCLNYLGKSAYCGSKRCRYFHICKDYLANGKCSQPAYCLRNHGLHDSHNNKLAAELFPDVKLTEEQLRQLIKSSTPQVCMAYNERKCFGSGLHCKKIHLCKNYVSGKTCNGGCHVLHKRGLLAPETKEVLAWLQVTTSANDQDLLRKLLICDDDDDVAAELEVSDVVEEMDELLEVDQYSINASSIENHICMKFLLKQCKEESSCTDHHCPMPYQWVYMAEKWYMFNESSNRNLERFFCDENLEDNQLVHLSLNYSSNSEYCDTTITGWKNVSVSRMEVRSENMIFPLKRLSTESEVYVPDCPLATRWRWLVKGTDGKLKEYEQQSQMDSSASVQVPHQKSKCKTSDAIEKHYLEGHSKYDYEMEGQRRRIYFKESPMYQTNAHSSSASTREEVERKPIFISQEDFETIIGKPCMLSEATTRQLPSTWTKMAECQDHLLVQLLSNSKEYQEMESLFSTHMADKLVTICSIDRIQNHFLWDKYTRKKDQMRKMAATRNDDPKNVAVDECLLFHATSHCNIQRICKQNFDWRSYGEGAPKIYGDGVYFSKDPSLSHWFCPGDDEDGSRYIFIFRVLVGSYTEGRKRYRHPPPKDPLDPSSEAFDSCVDRVGDPQVFVVFDVDQYYPGYLVEYRTRDSLAADLQTCSVQ